MNFKKLPTHCPSCDSDLKIMQLQCKNCETKVLGDFPLPVISRLNLDEQIFVLAFLKASGSLKHMSQNMKLSYPTVRNKLDDIIAKVIKIEKDED